MEVSLIANFAHGEGRDIFENYILTRLNTCVVSCLPIVVSEFNLPFGNACGKAPYISCLLGHLHCLEQYFQKNPFVIPKNNLRYWCYNSPQHPDIINFIKSVNKYLKKNISYPCIKHDLFFSIYKTDVLDMLCAIRTSIVQDHVDCLAECRKHCTYEKFWTSDLYMLCSRYDSLKCLKYLHEVIGIPIHEDTQAIAIKFQQENVINYLLTTLQLNQKSASYV